MNNNQIKSAAVRREVAAAARKHGETCVRKRYTIKTWEAIVITIAVVGLGILVGWYCIEYGLDNNNY